MTQVIGYRLLGSVWIVRSVENVKIVGRGLPGRLVLHSFSEAGSPKGDLWGLSSMSEAIRLEQISEVGSLRSERPVRTSDIGLLTSDNGGQRDRTH